MPHVKTLCGNLSNTSKPKIRIKYDIIFTTKLTFSIYGFLWCNFSMIGCGTVFKCTLISQILSWYFSLSLVWLSKFMLMVSSACSFHVCSFLVVSVSDWLVGITWPFLIGPSPELSGFPFKRTRFPTQILRHIRVSPVDSAFSTRGDVWLDGLVLKNTTRLVKQ